MTTHANNMDTSQIYYTKFKNPGFKDYLVGDSIYMTFWKRQKLYRDRKQMSSCQGLMVRRRDGQMGRKKLFKSDENALYLDYESYMAVYICQSS